MAHTKKQERRVFKKGDKVCWGSQAGGFSTMKQGTVVAVMPAKSRFHDVSFDRKQFNTDPIDPHSLGRDHESYIVMVPQPPSKAPGRVRRPKLYWPLVSVLRPLA